MLLGQHYLLFLLLMFFYLHDDPFGSLFMHILITENINVLVTSLFQLTIETILMSHYCASSGSSTVAMMLDWWLSLRHILYVCNVVAFSG